MSRETDPDEGKDDWNDVNDEPPRPESASANLAPIEALEADGLNAIVDEFSPGSADSNDHRE
jgi:hypothetical protein